jgi:ABC-2 type transport system permease protein
MPSRWKAAVWMKYFERLPDPMLRRQENERFSEKHGLGILKREFAGYFGSPVAYVFIVIFLLLSGFFTFSLSNFYEMGQADLRPFFEWHPWIFLFLIPAVAMRLWAEERRTGTIELILTLPVTLPRLSWENFWRPGSLSALPWCSPFPWC